MLWQLMNPRRWLPGLYCAGLATLVYFGCLAVPLRPQGADTVPGRLGMLALACEGSPDLTGVSWLREETRQGRPPYWVQVSSDQHALVSTFGPGPAYLGWPFAADLKPGTVITDAEIQSRARHAAAAAVSVSAFLAAFALLAEYPIGIALLAGLVAGGSFAGLGVLGQGLWQQSAALPFFMAAAAGGFWAKHNVWAVVPAVLAAVVAAWLRPPDIALAIALLAFALARAPNLRHKNSAVLVTLLGAVLVSLPFIFYEIWYFDWFLPASQFLVHLKPNDGLFALSLGTWLLGGAGLLVSPARGLLFYAPAWFVAIFETVRSRRRSAAVSWLGAGLLAQLLIYVSFRKWWGGICLGPRLLAIPCWIAILIATPVLLSSRRVLARLAAVALGLTLLSGILTARTYNPLRWEVPVNPNSNPVRFFDVEGYPPFALGRQPVPGVLTDAPARPQLFCSPRTLGP